MAEIKLVRKAGRSRKWAWLLLLLIPAVWFAVSKSGPAGDDDSASDSTQVASDSAARAATTPRTDTAGRKDTSSTKQPGGKPPA
ncbi:MAG TPA: hypothetical protein VFO55_07060 [Gemmatimonadaceae bacterium]|nr:hypothetical protein [Gemmatimonadaceae bacterium]